MPGLRTGSRKTISIPEAEPGSSVPIRLEPRDTAKLTAGIALSAIFVDAVLGHGLLWENDPYWTYWVTKTFLISAVFGLGTMWFGAGVGRGAAIAAAHTAVLTVYYWSFSPIGLPSHPEWLDLEHTWITGVPVHFGVIYLGYLLALWVFGQRKAAAAGSSSSVAWGALVEGVVIVAGVTAGVSLLLGEFPGATWMIVRLLITTTFLMLWWSAVGRDIKASLIGALMLASIWAAYGIFLGPSGLPDLPMRVLDPSAPGASVEWMTYRQIWLVLFPVSLIVMSVVGVIDSKRAAQGGERPAGRTIAVLAVVLVICATSASLTQDDARLSAQASGPVRVEDGPFFSNLFKEGTGTISLQARDAGGGRVTPLPPHDQVLLTARIETDGTLYDIRSDQVMVDDPKGRFTTWWGVGRDVDHHGKTGIGSGEVPNVKAKLAVFALADVEVDGELLASDVPLHVMTDETPGGTLEMDVGEPGSPIPGLIEGHLRAVWPSSTVTMGGDDEMVRYAAGSAVTLLLLVALIVTLRGEGRPRATAVSASG